MFISQIEMTGFKSFAAHTQLDFRPGVMAVVGPNGCGKTNIVDAVRWVLGEQRSGALRADRMEAVIFNGSSRRKPLGMSEVTLTIQNDRGRLPTPYSEVAITRRLFRSGESEYLINRQPTRLRDIQELFTDTGFGNNAYSIIELAMVEGMITGSSETRRSLFEEAAGVAKFKSRRQAAERRLTATRDALQRLGDVYGEVEKRYFLLKRQASRAKRCQSVQRALELRLLTDLADERLDLVSKLNPLRARLRELEDAANAADAECSKLSIESVKHEGAELAVIDREVRAQESVKRLERRTTEMEGELALTKQRLAHLRQEIDSLTSAKSEKSAELKQFSAEQARLEKTVQELVAELQQNKQALAGHRKADSNCAKELQAAREKLSLARDAEEEIKRKLYALRRRRDEARTEFNLADRRLKALSSEADTLRHSLKQMDESLKMLLERAEKAAADMSRCEAELAAAKESLATVQERHAAALNNAARLGAEREAAAASLKAHSARFAGVSGLPKTLRDRPNSCEFKTIASLIQCKPEYRAAIASALHSILDAIDLNAISSAFDIARGLDEGEIAAMRFPLEGDLTGDVEGDAAEFEGCIPVAALVENEGDLGSFLRRRLRRVFLTSDLASLQRLAPAAGARGVTLVCRGRPALLEPDGLLSAGSIDARAWRVGWESELAQLKESESAATAALTDAELQLKERSVELNNAEIHQKSARDKLSAAEGRCAEISRKIAGVKGDRQHSERRLNEIDAELRKLAKLCDELTTPDEAPLEITRVESELKSCASAREQTQKAFALSESEAKRLQSSISSITTEIAKLEERTSATRHYLQRSVADHESAKASLAKIDARLAGPNRERASAENAVDNLKAQMELLRRELSGAVAALENARRDRAAAKDARAHLASSLSRAQEDSRRTLKEHGRVEVEYAALNEKLREVDRRLVEDAKIKPETVTAKTVINAVADLEETGLSDLSADRLRARLGSFGPVNMLALEELQPVEERYRFLTDQRKDLENGIQVLEETIDRINVEARRLFRQTFDEINRNFQEIFYKLFGGGEARISLEGDDPLEADIRIQATPSGKKLQGLSTLSGGEKALTAVALLFSIYRVRPTPFCVLDEVDAPLDDANIVRFNRMVREFSADSQFLIVSHNKRTMEAADCLFGVTLGDDGASHLVSVKLERSEPALEAVGG